MGSEKVREPVQKRSIEKKKKIVEAGYELFCEKGYHNTNTAQIAKAAGVSTGIVYNYFADKKDIFMSCLNDYANSIVNPIYERLEGIESKEELKQSIVQIIDMMIESHIVTKKAHEEMLAMAHLDEDVGVFFNQFEEELTLRLTKILSGKGIWNENIHEKVHILYSMVENLCHEVVFHFHGCVNQEVMKNEVIKIIYFMIDSL